MRTFLVPLLLGCTALAAQAQSLKPGLWEISSSLQSGSGEMEKAMAQMQQQMASMSPEQKKMMQEMMKGQGVALASGGPGGMRMQVCMTKEMLDRNEVATPEGDCKSTYAARVGNTMKMAFTCSKPPSSGEGQVEFVSPQGYKSRMTITSSAAGRSEKMDMDSQGKWLSAECGAVKPIVGQKK
ncbi:DUF3617 domain-containing protein [Roseateles sp.]|uniref:DUF3617 domain-containing protein n=1 Tax=Roseateles sp. TaxID=1971397 RepID=UPI00286B7B73|nr:DUF3617 domain-containing protein [Roseateles sp.]